jgi:hypothetical protein
MNAVPGRSLELYYIDGRPDGMLTAELFNWTGHVLMAPRTQIAAALKRQEAGYAGVYLLIGEQNGEPRAYVGEGEDISARIKAHDVAKDRWSSAVLVTTAGNKLNKAHVRYLEARLIAEARAIGRTPLENGTNPPRPSLSEADVAKMEAFLENLLIVLPAVRVDMFIQRARPTLGSATPALSPALPLPAPALPPVRFTLETPKHGIKATAVLVDGEFVVQAGSLARESWIGQNGQVASYAPLHVELVTAGILAPHGPLRIFTQNYAFKSPSAAAAVINGRSTSGPQHWRLEGEGITYKEWEARQLGAPGAEAA